MTLIDAKELLEYIEGIPPLDSSLLRRAIINHIEETAFAEGAGALAYEKVFEEAYSSHIAKGADAYEAALLAHTDTKRERKNLIAQHKDAIGVSPLAWLDEPELRSNIMDILRGPYNSTVQADSIIQTIKHLAKSKNDSEGV